MLVSINVLDFSWLLSKAQKYTFGGCPIYELVLDLRSWQNSSKSNCLFPSLSKSACGVWSREVEERKLKCSNGRGLREKKVKSCAKKFNSDARISTYQECSELFFWQFLTSLRHDPTQLWRGNQPTAIQIEYSECCPDFGLCENRRIYIAPSMAEV